VTACPLPSAKQTFGTLGGKTTALHQLAALAAQRDGPQFVYRVALTDGSESLQQHVLNLS
jgi:hypothetical protein